MSSSSSPRLGLALPAQVDRFSTEEVKSNWQKIDAAPGTHICTSSTRPSTWGTNQDGRLILEVDTNLVWRWAAATSDWKRVSGGTGVLLRSDGTPAINERTIDFATSSTTFVRACTITNVVIPAGRRPIMVMAVWDQATNAGGKSYGAIFRSATNNSGPQMSRITVPQASSGSGPGANHIAVEKAGLSAGTYDFSLQFRCSTAGPLTISGDATQPISLSVIEL